MVSSSVTDGSSVVTVVMYSRVLDVVTSAGGFVTDVVAAGLAVVFVSLLVVI